MPWHIEEQDDEFCVIKDDDGESEGCHDTEQEAKDHMAALYASEEKEGARMTIRGLWERVKAVFEMALQAAEMESSEEETMDRATSFGSIFMQVDAAMYERDDWPWLHDLYFDDDDTMFGIASTGGKLFRFTVDSDGEGEVTLGEFKQVVPEFRPVGTETRTTVYRQADGSYRWLSISATAVLNRVGEIDSRALFDSFTAHAEETDEYPFRTFYHQGEALRYGQCDYMARDGYCLITSGLYDVDGENGAIAWAEIEVRKSDSEEWGESIGFLPMGSPDLVEIAEDVRVPVYDEGICREISLVPADSAAALFTTTFNSEVTRMREKVKEALIALFKGDEEAVEPFVEKTDVTNRAIEDDELIARDADADADTDDTDDQEDDDDMELVLDDAALDVIVGKVAEILEPITGQIADLQGAVADLGRAIETSTDEARAGCDVLNERLEALERDENDKRQEWLQDLPRKRQVAVTYRPRMVMPEERTNLVTARDIAQESMAAIRGD